MRRAVPLLLLLLLALGCTPTTEVDPGDGPAATEEPTAEGEPTFDPGDEPLPGETESPEPEIATFKDKYTYPDGFEVEVIRIKNSRFTKAQVQYEDGSAKGQDGEKPGDPYTIFTVRVRNGTKKTVELSGLATVTYGPDGTQAVQTYLLDTDYMEGKLIPGKSRSGTGVFLIPPKHYGDVVMEIASDVNRGSAVFAGSIK